MPSEKPEKKQTEWDDAAGWQDWPLTCTPITCTHTSAFMHVCRSLLQDPLRVTVGARGAAAPSVAQKLLFVGREAGKLLALRQLLAGVAKPPVLVFTATKASHMVCMACVGQAALRKGDQETPLNLSGAVEVGVNHTVSYSAVHGTERRQQSGEKS